MSRLISWQAPNNGLNLTDKVTHDDDDDDDDDEGHFDYRDDDCHKISMMINHDLHPTRTSREMGWVRSDWCETSERRPSKQPNEHLPPSSAMVIFWLTPLDII